MSEMIERISDVIERKMNASKGCVALEDLSRDILKAIREPTAEMLIAAYRVIGVPQNPILANAYRVMIDAAQSKKPPHP